MKSSMIVRPGYAGPEGIEPPIEVLETSVMPFNYGPKICILFDYTSTGLNVEEMTADGEKVDPDKYIGK
jgi:hypothetical protein